jgi:hypothetical protein
MDSRGLNYDAYQFDLQVFCCEFRGHNPVENTTFAQLAHTCLFVLVFLFKPPSLVIG